MNKLTNTALILLVSILVFGVPVHGSEQPSASRLADLHGCDVLMTQGFGNSIKSRLCLGGTIVTGLTGAYSLYQCSVQPNEWQKYTGITLLSAAATCLWGCVKYAKLSTLYWNAYSERMNRAAEQSRDSNLKKIG